MINVRIFYRAFLFLRMGTIRPLDVHFHLGFLRWADFFRCFYVEIMFCFGLTFQFCTCFFPDVTAIIKHFLVHAHRYHFLTNFLWLLSHSHVCWHLLILSNISQVDPCIILVAYRREAEICTHIGNAKPLPEDRVLRENHECTLVQFGKSYNYAPFGDEKYFFDILPVPDNVCVTFERATVHIYQKFVDKVRFA